MAATFAACDYQGGGGQSRVIGAAGAGRDRAGRDGGVSGQRLGYRV